MGYYVSYRCEVTIKPEQQAGMLAAINALHNLEFMTARSHAGTYSGGKRTHVSYSWVDDMPEGGWTSLGEALGAWRFEPIINDGNVTSFYFSGEKCGDEEDVLFPAIAPLMEGRIYAHGEDDADWGYEFELGEQMTELTCHKVWASKRD